MWVTKEVTSLQITCDRRIRSQVIECSMWMLNQCKIPDLPGWSGLNWSVIKVYHPGQRSDLHGFRRLHPLRRYTRHQIPTPKGFSRFDKCQGFLTTVNLMPLHSTEHDMHVAPDFFFSNLLEGKSTSLCQNSSVNLRSTSHKTQEIEKLLTWESWNSQRLEKCNKVSIKHVYMSTPSIARSSWCFGWSDCAEPKLRENTSSGFQV